MISVYVGNTGQGKTYVTACKALELLKRNKRWYEKKRTMQKRIVVSNMSFSKEIENLYQGYIQYWTDLEQLIGIRQGDVIFDDMGTYLDSQRWMDTPNSVKRWLRLHEHFGCDIYGNAQDFLTVDPSVRRLTYFVTHIVKVFGSRRPSATKPAVKYIWGLLMLRNVAEYEFDKEKIKYEYEGMPNFKLISREVCEVFDTTQELAVGEYPPLHHVERSCPVCLKVVAKHI